ncbi:MAG: hypothetical protein Q8O84_03710 [Nanoarchaeota archaeon]|nr:hypothetical protein [Nanoarchaeota archaeon]
MDFRKIIGESQGNFLNNPREGIIKFIHQVNNHEFGVIALSEAQKRPIMLKLFRDFRREHYSLINALLKLKLISLSDIRDDEKDIAMMMRIRELEDSIKDYQNKNKSPDIVAMRLSRNYATWMELFFKKFRETFKERLNLNGIKKKINESEKLYNIDLSNIKLYLDSKIRNSIDHEDTLFENPNVIIFLRDGKEIERLSVEEIIERLIELTGVNLGIKTAEMIHLSNFLDSLLRLNNGQLKEYCKTGILTKEMKEVINHL